MADTVTVLTLFGLGSCCGYLLYKYDQGYTPFYEENLTAMVGAVVGAGILFTLPYIAYHK